MDYILKASALLFIFYACYHLLLQKETFFQANRCFLLTGLIMSCIIPLVVIPIYIEYTVTNANNFVFNYSNSTPHQTITEEPFDYMQLILWTYFAGILFFFGKLIVDFLSLRKIIKSSKTTSLGAFKLLETHENITPFSFFNRIVYNPNQFKKEEITHIINHEKVHSQQWHSIDTLLSQVACILFWFNPIVWLYKKALQQNLEFIADKKAQHISQCEKSYQTVLLKASVNKYHLAITNNFHTSLIKKRIVMLHKSKSSKINQLKLVLVLPFLAFFMMSFNTKNVYVEIPLEEEKPTKALFQTKEIEQIFTYDMSDEDLVLIKKKLRNQGVTFDYSKIKRNKKGDITAIKTEFDYNDNSSIYHAKSDKAIEPFIFKTSKGMFVVGTFTDRTSKTYTTHNGKTKVQSTGSSNVYVIEEIENDEDSHSEHRDVKHEASAIVYESKTWTNKDGEKISINASENGKTNVFVSKSDEPLFVVNGKIVEKSVFENIDSDAIETINVLKDKVAIERFGEGGKNGVVLLRTKNAPVWAVKNKKMVTYEIGEPGDSINHRIVEKTYNLNSQDDEFIVTYSKDSKDEPLVIVDGVEGSNINFKKLDPNSFESMEIIKDNEALKLYGEKGKNGVIIIKTNTANHVMNTDNNPWKIKNEVTVIKFEDNNNNNNNGAATIEYILTKNATDAFLEKQKRELQKHGIDAKFSKVKRNKTGEITSIKITLDDNNGRKSSSSWKDKAEAIPDIVMGRTKEALFVRAIGN
ncbi:M56 family metallopeptidase [Psychroserpens damuponensis]|uniref:M56 family metallopeptidase n=1 Tax=Psychroserpens damuponensis TaxID=943936 RepID=UPI000694871E|nr:M56 family metallopeptidase [Psychroserpens damuponensis]